MDNDLFNLRPIKVRTQIRVHRWGLKTRFSALFGRLGMYTDVVSSFLSKIDEQTSKASA